MPVPGAVPPAALLAALVHAGDARMGGRVALTRRRQDAGRARLTFDELGRAVAGFAADLTATGVARGDRVVLLGDSSPDWVVAFFGVLAAGAVVVPLDPRLTAPELAVLVADAAPVALLASAETATLLADAAAKAGLDHDVRPIEPDPTAVLAAQKPAAEPIVQPERDVRDAAAIVYTSGTTGEPKGVTVSWDNLAYQAHAAVVRQRVPDGSVFVSILPTHHLYELSCGLLGPLLSGARVHYVESLLPADVVAAVHDEKGTHVVAVPLFLRAIRRRLDRETAEATAAKKLYLELAPKLAARLPRRARRLLLAPLHRRFGGRLTTFFLGGAPLDEELARSFDDLGFNVCQGYGLSEATPVVASNAARREPPRLRRPAAARDRGPHHVGRRDRRPWRRGDGRLLAAPRADRRDDRRRGLAVHR